MIFIYIVLGLIAAFFLLQFSMGLKMRMKKGKSVPDMNGAHGRMVKNGSKVMMYFFSPNCRACKSITPIIRSLSKKHKNVFSINITKDMDTARKLGILGTPSIVLVESGIIKEFMAGAIGESQIIELLN
ncbi:MAG: thioredoxin family protein [Spirochaetia bacterium]|jgi:thioredoxin 1|nr:thioredoxin family protein [Spirochaetia bacterium]